MAIKHLGIYREVTVEGARLDRFVLRYLSRRGSLGEGMLANLCGERVTDESWQSCLKRLIDWRMIEVSSRGWGNSQKIMLTGSGKYWAEELTSQKQREQIPVAPKKG